MKTVLITGANRGIGLEFAKQYAEDGWQVFACTRSPEKSEALGDLTARSSGRTSAHTLDVDDHAGIDGLAQALSNTAIDVLINNAGIYTDSHEERLDQIDYEAWARSFRINTMATLKMTQAFLPHLERSSQKKIVTISSKMGSLADNTEGGSYMYRSSKAAVNMVIKTLSIDLKPAGVIAIVFHPGWVQTDMGGPRAQISPAQSVSSMRRVIERLSSTDSGKFLSYDGQPVPW